MHIFGYKGWKHKLTKYKPSEAVDIVVKHLAPMFKTVGYKKKGRTWSKDMGGFLLIISIQGGRWNGETTGAEFQANYGIFVPQVFRALNTYEQPKHPTLFNCAFVRCIGGSLQRMPWEIFDNTDMDALQTSVAAQIKKECIDPFAQIASLEDVKTQLINGLLGKSHEHIVGLAVLCAEMGDVVNAKRYFNQAINDQTRIPSYREKAKEIAHRYNLR